MSNKLNSTLCYFHSSLCWVARVVPSNAGLGAVKACKIACVKHVFYHLRHIPRPHREIFILFIGFVCVWETSLDSSSGDTPKPVCVDCWYLLKEPCSGWNLGLPHQSTCSAFFMMLPRMILISYGAREMVQLLKANPGFIPSTPYSS